MIVTRVPLRLRLGRFLYFCVTGIFCDRVL